MAKVHPAARAEDALNAVVARRLRKRGWKLQIIPFTGYGGAGFARLMARVVLARDGQPTTAPTAEEAPIRRGFKVFFTAPLADVEVHLRCGAATAVATTDRGGYLDVELHDHGLGSGWHTADLSVEDVQAEAPVQIIGPEVSFGIISDVDDTCLVTALPRPMIAAWNSFVLEETARKVVPGMPAMYRALLTAHPGAPIVYLSTGAWNTQPILTRFLRRHGFPFGPLLLTDWGPTNDAIFRSGQAHKRESLRRLAREFPHIKWLLVGDDGQHDPVLYEDFAVEHPDNVACIAIRQLTATQQLLSHGHPLVRDELRGRPVRMMVCEGPDGFTLHRLVRRALATTDQDSGVLPMPELPEVQGLVDFLRSRVLDLPVARVELGSFSVLKTYDPPVDSLGGLSVTDVTRHGKFIDLDVDGIHLIFHLSRAGWLRWSESLPQTVVRPGKSPIALRVRFADDSGFDLTEAGTQKRLAVYVVRDPQQVPGIASLGPDPLEISRADFAALLAGKRTQSGRRTAIGTASDAGTRNELARQIKGLLRDQSVLAGVGNAYSDEVLHAAKLSPYAAAGKLDDEAVDRLYDALRDILTEAIAAASGKPAKDLKDAKRAGMRVHGRTGETCPVCGDVVREVSFADRSMQYCATCQTGGKPLADRRMSRLLK